MSPDPGGIRVVLADDQDLIRAGVRALLSRAPDLTVVAEAADGLGAVREVLRTRPDVVLMDLRMPGIDGIEATRRIVADPGCAAVRILVLTTFDTDDHLFAALRAGASGFLLKDARPEELRAAVRVVAAGEALLSPQVTARVIRAAADGGHRPGPVGLPPLTEREREILIGVGRGRSNQEIAADLVISPDTARTYVSRLLAKVGARDRAALVVLAYETGLVRPGDVD